MRQYHEQREIAFDTILQLIPAAPGWRAVYGTPGREPTVVDVVVAWGLVRRDWHPCGTLRRPQNRIDSVTSVLALVCSRDSATLEAVDGDGGSCLNFWGLCGPGEEVPTTLPNPASASGEAPKDGVA